MTTGVLEKPKDKIDANDGVKIVHAFKHADVVLFRRGLIDELVSNCGVLRLNRSVRLKRPDEAVQYCQACVLFANKT